MCQRKSLTPAELVHDVEARLQSYIKNDDEDLEIDEQIIDIPSSPELQSPGISDDEDDVKFISGLQASRTAAILDWDDTVCPSSHLASLGLRVDDISDLPDELRTQLEDLETAALGILKEALRYGAVIIITNAEAGWVELSGQRFLPRVARFIQQKSIKVISARTNYEEDFPNSPSNWKSAAFSAEVQQLFAMEDELNLLVLGDSISEREAAHALAGQLPSARIKTVKFVERPSIDQLQRQIELVQASYKDLCGYTSSFDVNLTLSSTSS